MKENEKTRIDVVTECFVASTMTMARRGSALLDIWSASLSLTLDPFVLFLGGRDDAR